MSGSAAPNYDDLFENYGQASNVDPTLLKAVTSVESGFNPNAVLKTGNTGLMQLGSGTASDLGVTDRKIPAQSIGGGAAYLRQMGSVS